MTNLPLVCRSDAVERFTNHLGIEFVRVRAGYFMMGVVEGDPDAESNEAPAFVATIPEDFFLASKPLTVAEFSRYFDLPTGEYAAREPDQAANWLSAVMADRVVEAMNADRPATERFITYMLPSEAEWEYACRAGTRTRFYFGDDPNYEQLGSHAWFAGNAWEVGLRSSQAPGRKGTNAWGLHDMHGNVWEWTRDGWGLYQDIAQHGDSARDSSTRVLRGGGWCHDARYLRSSDRDYYSLDYFHYYTGMRLSFRVR